jgi:hypothetical protein
MHVRPLAFHTHLLRCTVTYIRHREDPICNFGVETSGYMSLVHDTLSLVHDTLSLVHWNLLDIAGYFR